MVSNATISGENLFDPATYARIVKSKTSNSNSKETWLEKVNDQVKLNAKNKTCPWIEGVLSGIIMQEELRDYIANRYKQAGWFKVIHYIAVDHETCKTRTVFCLCKENVFNECVADCEKQKIQYSIV
jgi:hypothetical protein